MELFTISSFLEPVKTGAVKAPIKTEAKIIFYRQVAESLSYSLDDNTLKAKIKVSIHCTNGDYPPEPYTKTIKEIMGSVT